MGLLRFILACAVIIEHTSPIFGMKLTGGMVAVEAFFMISGFYMALILNQKYTGAGSYSLFLTNRFLKLFPIYWLILAAVILFGAYSYFRQGSLGVLSIFGEYGSSLPPSSVAYLIATNLLIFGQDIALFLKFAPDMSLAFTTDFLNAHPQVFRFLLIPPAWSLGVELTFYVIAPFLVRRSAACLVTLMAASLALRYLVTVTLGLGHDPWPTRFFPLELAFFLAGAVAFRAYAAMPWRTVPTFIQPAALATVVLLVVLFDSAGLNKWVLYIAFAVAMPFIFRMTKDSALDRHIGDLSYPMYVSHLLVFWVLSDAGVMDRFGPDYRGLLTTACTVLFSAALLAISRPVESFRSQRVAML